MNKNYYAKICAAVFVVVTVLSTLHAAAIDAGILISTGPLPSSGNYMGFGEAILFNIPIGIPEGILAVLIVAMGMFIFTEIKKAKQDTE